MTTTPRRPALAVALAVAGLIAFVYGAAYVDLVLRARSACLEGEKWLAWNERPELKKAHFDAELEARRAALERERAAGLLTADEYVKQVGLATFERDQAVAESSLKYAVAWFQSGAELFTPPENRWTERSREKLREARGLWKRELEASKSPAPDYMLE